MSMHEKRLADKLSEWEKTGTHHMTQDEIDEAIRLYHAVVDASIKLPNMKIVINHATNEIHRLSFLVGRDKRS